MKKLFAILMSIMMIACFMPTMAFATGTSGVIVEGTAPATIKVSGSFTEDGMIASGSVSFPEKEYKAASATLTVTIENTSDEAINNLQVIIDEESDNFEAGSLGNDSLANKNAQEGKTTTFTVTPKPDLSAGEHRAKVKIVNGEPSNVTLLAEFNVSFRVTKKKVTVPTAESNLVYTGKPQTGVKVGEGNTSIYTLTGNTETNAKDSYSATATLTDSTNYEWDIQAVDKTAAQTIPWSIAKKTPEATDFTFTAPENVTYNGEPKEATVALKDTYTGAGEVSLKYYKDGKAVDEAKDVGDYTVKIKVTGGTNFELTNELTADTWKFTITKVTPTAAHFDFTKPIDVTYDGTAKEATIALKKSYTGAGDVTVKYYKNGEEVQKENVKEPGEYTVKIDVGLGKNFNAASEMSDPEWKFTIVDKRGATANVAGDAISGETKVTLNQSFTITLEGGLTFNDTVKVNNDVSAWFAKDNLPKGLTAKITAVKDDKTSATITLSGIPAVKSEADILITIPQDSLAGAAADMPVTMNAKYAIKEFYMPTGGGGGGAAAKPAQPTTPEQKPATAAGKTAANTAITTAAAANKYDKAEQAEVDQIVKEAEAKIKEAKTEDEVKAIQKDAETKLDKILTTEEKATIASLKEVSKRDFGTKSKKITKKNGKKAVRLSWAAPEGVDVDGYEIFRSTKKNSGYGTEPYFETPKTSYTNSKGLKSGKTYYYRVRAYVEINGERHYTDYSTKASRKI